MDIKQKPEADLTKKTKLKKLAENASSHRDEKENMF